MWVAQFYVTQKTPKGVLVAELKKKKREKKEEKEYRKVKGFEYISVSFMTTRLKYSLL